MRDFKIHTIFRSGLYECHLKKIQLRLSTFFRDLMDKGHFELECVLLVTVLLLPSTSPICIVELFHDVLLFNLVHNSSRL